MNYWSIAKMKLTQIFGVFGGITFLIIGLVNLGNNTALAILLILIGIAAIALGATAKHMLFKDKYTSRHYSNSEIKYHRKSRWN
ncbi:MAG: hypothetical protein WC370_08990 [Dehalococcoidales bacterium]|jgi:uncharacterized membrane protein HdeD (DUF308 family)